MGRLRYSLSTGRAPGLVVKEFWVYSTGVPNMNLKLARCSAGYWIWQLQPKSFLCWNWNGFITGDMTDPQPTDVLRAVENRGDSKSVLIDLFADHTGAGRLASPPAYQGVSRGLGVCTRWSISQPVRRRRCLSPVGPRATITRMDGSGVNRWASFTHS